MHVRPFLTASVRHQLGSGHDALGTWWPAVLAGVLAGVLAVVAVRSGRRRRAGDRRYRPVLVRATAALLVAVVAVAAGINTHTGYLPTASALRAWVTRSPQPGAGRVHAVVVPSEASWNLDRTTTYVWTPPGYRRSAGVRYPVVYLFHGSPGTSVDWFAAGGIVHTLTVLESDHLVPEVIAVAPDLNAPSTDDTECLDSTRPGGPQVTTYLDHVVSWVDAHYDTQGDPSGRIVAGMSSGGYCAVDQGLTHQDLYGGIIGLEPYSSPGAGGHAALATAAQYAAASPSHYLPTMDFTHRTPTFLDMAGAGRSPVSSSDAEHLAVELHQRGQPVYLRREVGLPHSWTMASRGAPYALVWTSHQMHLHDVDTTARRTRGAAA